MRAYIYTAIWVVIACFAIVGTSLYFNPAVTIASIKGEKVESSNTKPKAGAESKPEVKAATQPKSRHSLTITVNGLRNSRGQVIMQLYNNAQAFDGNQYDRAVETIITPAKGFAKQHLLKNLPLGDYAIIIIHDENSNGEYDTAGSFYEGYAYSNDAGKNDIARFHEARFELTEQDRDINLTLIYH